MAETYERPKERSLALVIAQLIERYPPPGWFLCDYYKGRIEECGTSLLEEARYHSSLVKLVATRDSARDPDGTAVCQTIFRDSIGFCVVVNACSDSSFDAYQLFDSEEEARAIPFPIPDSPWCAPTPEMQEDFEDSWRLGPHDD